MKPLHFDDQQRYLLEHYQQAKPFTSFLPGIAGLNGIPMWVFYVNRGQAITSFGIGDKDHPILEFQPANKAYQLTPYLGFRTFIRPQEGGIFEPFASHPPTPKMWVGMNELEIEDLSPQGLQTNVLYFTLTNQPLAGLVRRVTITNTTAHEIVFEMLDGLPVVIPYGLNNYFLKEMGRTMEAWMNVEGLEAGIAIYKLRASVSDSTEVQQINAANFAISFLQTKGETIPLAPFVDPRLIFGQDTSFGQPERFLSGGLQEMASQKQVTTGRAPCAFFGCPVRLEPGAAVQLFTVFGYAPEQAALLSQVKHLQNKDYLEDQRNQARLLADNISAPIDTHTAIPEWDAYCRQTFLDNLLRGGMPVLLGDKAHPHVTHVYSRKHGDPERDYNYFSLLPEYYSQGNGSYRDVNQNRRSDAFFYPAIADNNIRQFLSLIQLDGYNPLVLSGNKFTLSPAQAAALTDAHNLPQSVQKLLGGEFTPGQLLHALEENTNEHPDQAGKQEQVFHAVFNAAQVHTSAHFGEGYWVDHWTYNLDLIESYLAIYPEAEQSLFFKTEIPIFNSPMVVLPRNRRFVSAAPGSSQPGPRQYHGIVKDEEKADQIAKQGNWVYTFSGDLARTSIFARLYMLAWLKTATLDPYGMGVEMEAGRPGWYDALNGLPALLGSSMPETYQLVRLVRMLRAVLRNNGAHSLALPEEFAQFIQGLAPGLVNWCAEKPGPTRDLERWNAAANAREHYRAQVRLGISGQQVHFPVGQVNEHLDLLEKLLSVGLERANSYGADVPLTYFCFPVTKALPAGGHDTAGRDYIIPQAFDVHPLPLFLEGPVHALRLASTPSAALRLHQAVLNSPLYDPKLRMFKVNASLAAESHEIGRARAFPPGWLENESIWLHMEYKYLLELLKAGAYPEFWNAAQAALVPFQDPERYGRSPLENVSFIASSAHPDENLHGAGFVARLSGSTAEFLSIWFSVMTGGQPFTCNEKGELMLTLRPALPAWLFAKNGRLSFTFLGHTRVTYENPHLVDTWKNQAANTTLKLADGRVIVLTGPTIPAPYATMVRQGQVAEITMEFRKK